MSVYFFADDSSYGPNQIALIFSAFVAALLAFKNGLKWSSIESAMVNGVSLSMRAIFILLAVGALIGAWLMSGTVPALIFYGLELLSPRFFYPASCLVCAIVALCIGSSWTVAATVGVALMGVSEGLGMNSAISAGAIISGAYFGDKMSPFSDTTNLAPAVVGTELFAHIRYMALTSLPSIVMTLAIFTVIGFSAEQGAVPERIDEMKTQITSTYNIELWVIAPLLLLFFMAFKKVAAFPAVFIAALVGCLWTVLFQQNLLQTVLGDLYSFSSCFKFIWQALFAGFEIKTSSPEMNDLLSGGGMSSMLNTVWLIICAMIFGAVMEKAGFLACIITSVLKQVKSTGGLVSATVSTCFFTNIATADQYISIVIPGRMYKQAYQDKGLDPLNLSRTLEDAGTLSSPLIPWNTCGAYMHSVLLVNPLEYVFYCFFNLINPLLSIMYAYIGFKIKRLATAFN